MFKQALPSNKHRTRRAKNQISAAALIQVNTLFTYHAIESQKCQTSERNSHEKRELFEKCGIAFGIW